MDKRKKISNLIGFILLFTIGVYLLGGTLLVFYKQWMTFKFNETEGKVISSEIGHKIHARGRGMGVIDVYYPKIVYEYKVNNNIYKNNVFKLISFFGTGNTKLTKWQEIVNCYSPGEKCKIYYNPSNLRESCLIREIDTFLILFFFCLGGFSVIQAFRVLRKQS